MPPKSEPESQGESLDARIHRLGRQRPSQFASIWSELGFLSSIMLAQMMAEYYISGFTVLLPSLAVSLDLPTTAATWPASAFSLTAGSLFLLFGRISDIFGAPKVFLSGLAWHTIWGLAASFSQNPLAMNICRAAQGIGPAAFLPASISLLATTYRPGVRKNVVFSVYGACAPVGFFLGIFFSGIAVQAGSWRIYFWIGTVLVFLAVLAGIFTVPRKNETERSLDWRTGMDWMGAVTIIAGLILTTAAVTESARAPNGWATWYIILLFVIGIGFLAVAVYVEGWVAKVPLLPFDMFKVPGMLPLTIALFFSYGVFGTWLFYTTFYLQNILHLTPLQVVAYNVPFGMGGLVLPTLCGFILHLLPGTYLLIISGIAWILAPLLITFATPSTSYWQYIFPAMICGTLGIDITYNVTNVFITTSLPESRQGLAGALINSLLFFGNSFFLGWADVVVGQVENKVGNWQAYRIVLWYAAGCAAIAVILVVGWVRVGKAESELTPEERAAMEAEVVAETRQNEGVEEMKS